MTSEEALKFIEAILESKTGKQLTPPEKEIIKAAWDNETYSNLAQSLYLTVGHVKDLAYILWQHLSDIFGQKITKNNLRRVIENFGNQSTLYKSEISENNDDKSYSSPPPRCNILIVEDMISIQQLLTKFLSKHGYKVRSFSNGKMALNSIRNNPTDIILLDIKIPDMNGYEVCKALKADEVTSEIPIIFLSSLDEPIDKVKAFKLGGSDYITKPFEPEEILARIKTQLTIQEQKKQLKEQIQKHQKNAEILYQSRALLASLLNSSKDGIAAIEAVRDALTEEINDFRCLVVNSVFAKLLGQKRTKLMNQPTLKHLLNQLTPTLFDSLVEVVETGEAIEQEFYWENHHEQFWYYLTAVKFNDGCSITVCDITKFKLLEFNPKMESHL